MSTKRVALITGIAGQDGSYLSEFLLQQGYTVYGILRRASIIRTERIDHILDKIHLSYGDVTDASAIHAWVQKVVGENSDAERFEIYNLAAQSHVAVSFDLPSYTGEVDAFGVVHLLEAIRGLPNNVQKKVRLYQASTSELFGKIEEKPQRETTPFHPTSPYAIAKQYAHWMVKLYREAYGLFACSGLLFNHESSRRGETFVTRKITIGIGKILRGEEECLRLGNLDSLRDWGHAKDYVKGMWMMLQAPEPKDYVLATGKQYSVREFVERCFAFIGRDISWKGEGVDEVGVDTATGNVIVRVDARYFRPSDVDDLLGDAYLARHDLGWQPTTTLDELVAEMVKCDCFPKEKRTID